MYVRLKKRKKNIYHATWNKKKGGEAILISDKEVIKTKKEHFMMTKVSIQQGDIIKKTNCFLCI